MSTVLVTGATGNIGRQLISLLCGNSAVTTVPCFRQPSDADKFTAMGLAPVQLDMDDPLSARNAVLGVDILFLLKPYTIRMLMQSKVMLDAARAAGVGHVVHLGAYGADDSPWATIGWNHMVERYIEALGFSWTHLRPNFFMDNLFRSARHESGVAKSSVVGHFLGDLPISWVSCRDIAAVTAAVILDPQAHQARTYPLAADRCSMPELAGLLSELTGRQYRYERLPAARGFEMMTRIGREPEFVRPWLDYMAAVADGRVAGVDEVFDNILPLTGQAPLRLREFIAQNAQRFS